MRTLLVGIDNPLADDPRLALYPIPEGRSGDRLVQLIARSVPGYNARQYLRDFARTNLYPSRRAPEGRGRVRNDRDAIAQMLILTDVLEADDVVLFGQRTVDAFNSFYDEHLDWLGSCVIPGEQPRRFWALPHPSGRNRWYNVKANADAAGKLLARLRDAVHPATSELAAIAGGAR